MSRPLKYTAFHDKSVTIGADLNMNCRVSILQKIPIENIKKSFLFIDVLMQIPTSSPQRFVQTSAVHGSAAGVVIRRINAAELRWTSVQDDSNARHVGVPPVIRLRFRRPTHVSGISRIILENAGYSGKRRLLRRGLVTRENFSWRVHFS